MIGIATVARPGRRRDQERQRQEQQEHQVDERDAAETRDRLLGGVEDGVGDLAVGHDHGHAAGDADDQRDARAGRAAPLTNASVNSPRASVPRTRSGSRTAGTRRSSRGTTTSGSGKLIPRSAHGIDADDHHDEREEEQDQHEPAGGPSSPPARRRLPRRWPRSGRRSRPGRAAISMTPRGPP